jgi:hypothetical protein
MTFTLSPALPRTGRHRSPTRTWAVSVVTLGVGAVAHHYVINRELRDFGVEVRPLASALALLPGAVLVVPPFVTLWRTSTRIAVARETAGLRPAAPGVVAAAAIVLFLFAGYHQRELNRVWEADG